MLQYKDITEQTKELIAQDYNQGMNFDQLSHKYTNICKDLIIQCLYEKADVPKRSYLPKSRAVEWKQAVVDYYKQNSSFDTIKFFRTSKEVFLRTLSELNVQKRSHAEELKLNKIVDYGSIAEYNTRANATTIQTCLQRYGVVNFAKSSLFNERCEATCMKKYGVKNPMQSDVAKLSMKQHNQEKYGVDWPCQLPHVRQSQNGSNSAPNLAFQKLLEDYNITYVREKGIGSYSYDFLINNNILVEINPTSTHNADWGAFSPDPLPENYHQEKYDTAIEAGYRCVMLWDWDNAESFIKSLVHKYLPTTLFTYTDKNTVKIDPYISLSEFTKVLQSLPQHTRIQVDSDKIFDSRYHPLKLVDTKEHSVLTSIKTNEVVESYLDKHTCRVILPEIFVYTL